MSLTPWAMSWAIWNYCCDYCAFCPRNLHRDCRDDCRAGIAEWLKGPYIKTSAVWRLPPRQITGK